MGDEHILSQDELDVLLGAEAVGASGTRIDLHTLQEAFIIAFQGTGGPLTQLLGEEINIFVESAQMQSHEATIDVAGRPFVVHCSFNEALQGSGILVMDETIALGMATQLLEGTVPNHDQAIEPLAEMAQVWASSLSDQLSALMERTVSVTAAPRWGDGTLQLGSVFESEGEFITFEVAFDVGSAERSLGYFVLQIHLAEEILIELGRAAGEEALPRTHSESEPVLEQFPAATDTGDEIAAARATETTAVQPEASDTPVVRAAEFAPLGTSASDTTDDNLGLLLDVPLKLTVELGRTEMEIRDILALSKGQVIELDKLAGEPVDIFVNGKLVAKGEVVVMDENFAVKISHIVERAGRV